MNSTTPGSTLEILLNGLTNNWSVRILIFCCFFLFALITILLVIWLICPTLTKRVIDNNHALGVACSVTISISGIIKFVVSPSLTTKDKDEGPTDRPSSS